MSRTITKLSLWFAIVVLTACSCILAQAQDNTMAQDKSMAKASKPPMQVTGCVQKGDEAGGFTITGEDGKVWELHGTKVNVGEHAGHKVTVTGHVMHNTKMHEAKMEKHETQEASGKPYADFSVTSLKMVSETCQ
jgi:hypothetical protein